MKELISGNEAIARGAYEANAWVAAGYPGTPSSEIIESIIMHYPEINAEWSVNEKVAVETAMGSSLAGIRSIATMKHVGLNVAADPLMTISATGINAGLVIAVADDPAMHSSQNEQDSRNYSIFARVPLLEPSGSQEALAFTKTAFSLSEAYDTPVILRTVTRVSHTRSVVETGEPGRKLPVYNYVKDPSKYVLVPANAVGRNVWVHKRWEKLELYSEGFTGHSEEYRSDDLGIITSGLAYQYVREVFPEASVFKVSMYPVPVERIRTFASRVNKLYVIEELDDIIEKEIKAAGIESRSGSIITGKDVVPSTGELLPEKLMEVFNISAQDYVQLSGLPPRPPQLCRGCGHTPVFEVLHEMNVVVLGDIGCYSLGALEPYNAMDTAICMGSGAGNETGFKKLQMLSGQNVRSVGVIGDSTFFHSGMTNLLNAVYNNVPVTLLILDNRFTAMTGHQPNPGSGLDRRFSESERIIFESLARGLGVKNVSRANAYKKDELRAVINEEIQKPGPSVIIISGICVIGENLARKMVK